MMGDDEREKDKSPCCGAEMAQVDGTNLDECVACHKWYLWDGRFHDWHHIP